MKDVNYKNSVQTWVKHLFNQVGQSLKHSQEKSFFSHRYQRSLNQAEQSPFSELFSNSGQKALTDKISPTQTICSFHSPIAPQPRLQSDNTLNGDYQVVNCFDETRDTKTFRLASSTGQLINYLPGQYVTLTLQINGRQYKRSYSLATSPTRPQSIELTIKRDLKGGIVSNWLNDRLKIGDTLSLKGPFGNFTCALQLPKKVLFIAAGSGIVPIMSMLRWLTDIDADADIQLLLSFRSMDDIIFLDELKWIASRYRRVSLDITLTTNEIDQFTWQGLSGRINDNMINQLVADLPERTVYLCGPDRFMADCKKYLMKQNLPEDQLFTESFSIDRPSSVTIRQNQVLRPASGAFRISCAKSGHELLADGQKSLLELIELAGLTIEHECRTGECGSCMVKCLKGNIDMTEQADIDEIDKVKGWVLSCCSYPLSDVVLDI